MQEQDRETFMTSEALFAEFVKDTPRRPDVYVRWRVSGIPAAWLVRLGFPSAPLRVRRGPLP